MHPVRKRRLIGVLLLMLGIGVSAALGTYALRQNISLYFTPTQIQRGEAANAKNFRIGGMVKKGSVKQQTDSLDVEFVVTDFNQDIVVRFNGLLPDLFREEQGIVVQGHLNSESVFIAHEVLAKHDEKYMPPAAKQALENKNKS